MGDQYNHWPGNSPRFTAFRHELLAVVSGCSSFVPFYMAPTAPQACLDKK